MEKKHLGLRIDAETQTKFHYIAASEGRSVNGQILHMVHKCIREFEREHGPIPTDNKLK